MHHGAMGAILGAGSGMVAAVVGAAHLVAANSPDAAGAVSDWGAFLTAGGTFSAVGCLAYVARLFANGSLVAREPAQAEKDLAAAVARLEELVDAGHKREERLMDLLTHRATGGAAHAD